MDLKQTCVPDVLLLTPQVFGDSRGFFLEAWNKTTYANCGITDDFVQLNHSLSKRGILRGLHFQYNFPQGKLVRVLQGEVFDVAVDLRRDSNYYGKWTGHILNSENHRQLWIPKGFAHGFCVLSEEAHFEYLCTDFYRPEDEGVICWSDPQIGINWPSNAPLLSKKDAEAPTLKEIESQLRF
jgi:dTDP-4-dehydrorhamnose 3,5-epimerase